MNSSSPHETDSPEEVGIEAVEYRLDKLLSEPMQDAVDALIYSFPGVDVDPDEENPGDFMFNGKKYIVTYKVEEYEPNG